MTTLLSGLNRPNIFTMNKRSVQTPSRHEHPMAESHTQDLCLFNYTWSKQNQIN